MTKTSDDADLHTTTPLPTDSQDTELGDELTFTERPDPGEGQTADADQLPKGSWPAVLGGEIELPSQYGTPEH